MGDFVIDRSKILLGDAFGGVYNKAQILHINNPDEGSIEATISNIDFNFLPELFVIVVEVKNFENVEKYQELLSQKFTNKNQIFVQFYSSETKTSKFYKKSENDELKEILFKLNICEDAESLNESQIKIKDKEKFSNTKKMLKNFKIFGSKKNNKMSEDIKQINLNFEDFLLALNTLKTTFINVNLNNILEQFELVHVDGFLMLIKSALKACDDVLIQFLMLYVSELSVELEAEFLKPKENPNLQLKILIGLINDIISTKLIEKILNSKKINEILNLMVKQGSMHTLDILSKNKKDFSFEMWSRVRKITVEVHSDNMDFNKNFQLMLEKEFFDSENACKRSVSGAIQDLHKKIECGNLEEVKKIVEVQPNFKVCFDDKNKSALEKSFDCAQYTIYAFLQSQNFLSQNKIDIDKESLDTQRLIRDEIRKFTVVDKNNYLMVLFTKCALRSEQGQIVSSDIQNMLDRLSEINDIQWTLQIAAKSEVEIIFDFLSESVVSMDPTRDEYTLGLAYFEKGTLYVGKNRNKAQRYGTFAHEMTHYVLYLIYKNKALPYCKGDTEREKKWKEIVEITRQKHKDNPEGLEVILRRVFSCYKEGYEQEAELAVRPNDMLGFYHDNKGKIKKLATEHPELFGYYRNLILPDFQIPFVYEMIKLNEDLELLNEIEESKLHVMPPTECTVIKHLKDNKRVLITSNAPQLLLSKIYQEIKSLPGNKLNFKVRNVFISSKALEQNIVLKALKKLLSDATFDRVIVDLKDFKEEHLGFIKTLNNKTSCIVVSQDVNMLEKLQKLDAKFVPRHSDIQWSELNENAKKALLKTEIIFQNNPISPMKRFICHPDDLITENVLKTLYLSKDIKINCCEVKKIANFIPRSFLKKREKNFESRSLENALDCSLYEDFPFDNFMESISSSDDYCNIFLISDAAGSGKTTVLMKIYEKLISVNKEPKNASWVSFITLKDQTNVFDEYENESFCEFIAKLLNLDELSKIIFKEKYSHGKVKILFDGLDEIPIKTMQNVIKIVQKFEFNEKNQIFITSRTHLEYDVEKALKILGWKIKPLEESDQVDLFVSKWEGSDEVEKTIDAKKLIKKLSEVVGENQNLIGLPFIVVRLADVFKKDGGRNLDEEIEKLKISTIYGKILSYFFDVEKEIFDPIIQYIAVVHLMGKFVAVKLGLSDDLEKHKNEIMRGDVISEDKNGKIIFKHEMYAEFFLASLTFSYLENKNNITFSQHHKTFFKAVLTDEKLEFTRMFLNDMLNMHDTQLLQLNIFKSKNFFCDLISESKDFSCFRFIEKEGLSNIYELLMELCRSHDKKLFNGLLEYKDEEGKTIIMKLLPMVKSTQKFEKLLNKIINYHALNVFDEFYSKTDKKGNTILHHLTRYCTNADLIEIFWDKLNTQNFLPSQCKQIIFHQNDDGDVFILSAFYFVKEKFNANNYYKVAEQKKIHKEKIEKIFKIVSENMKEEELRELVLIKNERGDTVFHMSVLNDEAFDLMINLVENCSEHFEKPDFLQHSSIIATKTVFDILWGKWSIKASVKELFERKSSDGRNLLQCSMLNVEIFSLVFDLITQNFKNEEIEKFIFEKNVNNLNLISIGISSGFTKNVKILLQKISEIFDQNKLKNYFADNEFELATHLALILPSCANIDIINLIWGVLDKNLTRDEMIKYIILQDENNLNWDDFKKNLRTNKNKNKNSLLHQIAISCTSKEILENLLIKISTLLNQKEKIKKYLLIPGGNNQRNPLMLSITDNKNETTFNFLFENVYMKYFNLREFLYEVDDSAQNLFHLIAQFGSNSMFKMTMNEILKFLTKIQLTDLISLKNKDGDNAFHLAVSKNKSEVLVRFFIEIIKEKIVGEKNLKIYLAAKGHKERSPIRQAKDNNDKRNYIILKEFYDKYFLEKEMIKLLAKPNKKFNFLRIGLRRSSLFLREAKKNIILSFNCTTTNFHPSCLSRNRSI